MGLTSGTHGLMCDSLLGLEIVLWNGTVVWANVSQHQDLFWASCGGGGGLGVVTEFKLKLHKLPVSSFTRISISSVIAPMVTACGLSSFHSQLLLMYALLFAVHRVSDETADMAG